MNDADRRSFLTRATAALGALIAAGLGAPAALYLLAPGKRKKQSDWIEVGEAAGLIPRQPEEVVFRRNRNDGWKVTSEKATAWIVKLTDSEVVALAPQCTHLGCAYRFDALKGEFLCPCHTSAFAVDGHVLSGPAPRALDRYEVKVEHGRILIGGLDTPRKNSL